MVSVARMRDEHSAEDLVGVTSQDSKQSRSSQAGSRRVLKIMSIPRSLAHKRDSAAKIHNKCGIPASIVLPLSNRKPSLAQEADDGLTPQLQDAESRFHEAASGN